MPPAAMSSRSLGAGVSWPPSACRGTMVNPAVAAAALARKVLRGTEGRARGSDLPDLVIEFSCRDGQSSPLLGVVSKGLRPPPMPPLFRWADDRDRRAAQRVPRRRARASPQGVGRDAG